MYSSHQRGKNSGCTVSGYIHLSFITECIYSRKVKRPASRGQAQAVPSGVGKTKVPPVNTRAHKGWIQVALQRTPQTIQDYLHNQQLHRLLQTKYLFDLYSRPAATIQNRSHAHSRHSRILQPSVPGTETRQPLETSHRSKFLEQIPWLYQNSSWNPLSKGEWITSINLMNGYLHVTIYPQTQMYLRFCFKNVFYQFTCLPFGRLP